MLKKLSWIYVWSMAISAIISTHALAGPESFGPGSVITGYGDIAKVADMIPISPDATFNVAFDITAQAEPGEVNRSLNSLARFINMHVGNGVKLENIHLAAVIHSKATYDLLNNIAYQKKFQKDNINVDLIRQLLANNTQIFLCGQASTKMGITKDQLVPGIKITLSAMTAHALLQQQGYTLNP
ncbi:DsrE family protein [Aliiglaciecola sp. 3_MG-2023]|uniref:DsrE family protein n=1 Tax=Aliiglaciecola sp. 3_MG-2023 TaxID=3062644 RepID=UPI0026E3D734|nr:DsrE family protein [Aliiglaciecola sp. 3_MG-2023]MDO6695086.1 DsrE family protein [Aliiglaciecola sp. 3_MG-2023]